MELYGWLIAFVYPLLYMGLLAVCLIGAVRTKYKVPFALLSLYSGLYFVFASIHLAYFLKGKMTGEPFPPALDDFLTYFCMVIEPIGIVAFLSGMILLVRSLVKAQRGSL